MKKKYGKMSTKEISREEAVVYAKEVLKGEKNDIEELYDHVKQHIEKDIFATKNDNSIKRLASKFAFKIATLAFIEQNIKSKNRFELWHKDYKVLYVIATAIAYECRNEQRELLAVRKQWSEV